MRFFNLFVTYILWPLYFCISFAYGFDRVILYSGTFDPPHIGHVNLVQEALAQTNADGVFVIPNVTSDHKGSITDYQKRKHMTKLAFKDVKNVLISDLEIESAFMKADIDGVKEVIMKRYPEVEIIQVMGDDSYERFLKATNNRKLKQTSILVAKRVGSQWSPPSSAQTPVKVLNLVDSGVSSSAIREKILTGFIPNSVSDDVKRYILQNKLYGYQCSLPFDYHSWPLLFR